MTGLWEKEGKGELRWLVWARRGSGRPLSGGADERGVGQIWGGAEEGDGM